MMSATLRKEQVKEAQDVCGLAIDAATHFLGIASPTEEDCQALAMALQFQSYGATMVTLDYGGRQQVRAKRQKLEDSQRKTVTEEPSEKGKVKSEKGNGAQRDWLRQWEEQHGR